MLSTPTPVISVEREVLGNLLAQPIGGHQVADLNLPEAFLGRVAGRIIRESFEERHRLVVRSNPEDAPPPPEPSAQSGPPPHGVRVIGPAASAAPAEYWASLKDGRPELRGYRAPIRSDEQDWPPLDTAGLTPAERDLAQIVARRLAREGLLLTLAEVMHHAGAGAFPARGASAFLARVGFPVDLLGCFAPDREPATTIATVAATLARAGGVAPARRELGRMPFRWTPTVPGLRAISDSGQEPLRGLRVQLGSARDWTGPGDGGALDLIRQLAAGPEAVPLTVSVARGQLGPFLDHVAAWHRTVSLTVVPQARPPAQWAQDNGKLGRVGPGDAVLLAPRFATRGEVGAEFIPGESVAVAGLEGAGWRIARSPLHFQGGNLIAVEEEGSLTLLTGEAEVWRNVSLGLSAEQATAALGAEFGADRCIVLPAVSFHADMDVCVRSGLEREGMKGTTVAFIADEPGAARIILGCGLGALRAHGLVSEADESRALAGLAVRHDAPAIELLSGELMARSTAPGRWSEEYAALFSTGPTDHGASNLYRVLLAIDLLLADALSQQPRDRHARAYFESLRRRQVERRSLARQLDALGWRTVPVPALPEPYRGVNPLNGLHHRSGYWMPGYGGLLEALDVAARQTIAAALGPELPIRTFCAAETQRRSGGLRCAAAFAIP